MFNASAPEWFMNKIGSINLFGGLGTGLAVMIQLGLIPLVVVGQNGQSMDPVAACKNLVLKGEEEFVRIYGPNMSLTLKSEGKKFRIDDGTVTDEGRYSFSQVKVPADTIEIRNAKVRFIRDHHHDLNRKVLMPLMIGARAPDLSEMRKCQTFGDMISLFSPTSLAAELPSQDRFLGTGVLAPVVEAGIQLDMPDELTFGAVYVEDQRLVFVVANILFPPSQERKKANDVRNVSIKDCVVWRWESIKFNE